MALLDIIINIIKKNGEVEEVAYKVPDFTEADEGKVLGVQDGALAWVNPSIKRIVSDDTENLVVLRDLDSGCYVLYGRFLAYAGADSAIMFSSDMVVNIVKKSAKSEVQVFYPVNNCVQYLKITDDSSERTNVYLNDLQAALDAETA